MAMDVFSGGDSVLESRWNEVYIPTSARNFERRRRSQVGPSLEPASTNPRWTALWRGRGKKRFEQVKTFHPFGRCWNGSGPAVATATGPSHRDIPRSSNQRVSGAQVGEVWNVFFLPSLFFAGELSIGMRRQYRQPLAGHRQFGNFN